MRDPRSELIRDHLATADMYTAYWEAVDTSPAGLSAEEIAYELLLHAGMHARYSGNTQGVQILRKLPNPERERLIAAACRSLIEADLSKQARCLAEEAMVDDAAGEEYEQYVYERDSVDVLLRMVAAVGGELLSRSPALNKVYLQALAAENALDEVLEAYAELTALHAQTVLFLRDQIVLDRDKPHAWWSARLERLREDFYAPTLVDYLVEGLAEAADERNKAAAKKPSLVARVAEGLYSMQAWMAEFRRELLALRLPEYQPAFGGAASKAEQLAFRVENASPDLDPFTVFGAINKESNTLDLEFFDRDGGLARLDWLPRSTLLIRSHPQEERFIIDEREGVARVALKDVPPTGDTTFEIRDRNDARVCTLVLVLPEENSSRY